MLLEGMIIWLGQGSLFSQIQLHYWTETRVCNNQDLLSSGFKT